MYGIKAEVGTSWGKKENQLEEPGSVGTERREQEGTNRGDLGMGHKPLLLY